MRFADLSVVLVLVCVICATPTAARERGGVVEGRVAGAEGESAGGVRVSIDGTSLTTTTDRKGRFLLRGVPPGRHVLRFTLGDQETIRADVVVEDGRRATVDQVLDWQIPLEETVTVYSVSRHDERIVDAPGTVTTVGEEQIHRVVADGRLQKLFEFTPGVYVTETGLYDFNISTRGFNGALTRRVVVLVDGRDTADPFAGAPEPGTLTLPLDDFASAELLRGPSSALYGANATGGVLSLSSKSPRDSPGGTFRLTSGQGDTTHADFRWAGHLASDWYLKIVGSGRRSDDIAVSRLEAVEYSVPCTTSGQTDCLPRDTIPLRENDIDIASGALRLDKYLAGGDLLTFEVGSSDYRGPIFVNPGGTRGQFIQAKRRWARLNWSRDHWNLLVTGNDRDSESVSLATGAPFLLDAQNHRVELQTNWSLADERVRLVAGGSYRSEEVETAAVRGGSIDIDEQAVFAQADWQIHGRVKLVAAARWDDSALHDAEISPKASLVWTVSPRQTARASYNRAFQVPTYVELFLVLPFGATDTSGLESICTNAGTTCGLEGTTPVFVFGNEELEAEQTTTYEIGYRGVLGSRAFVSVEAYQSRNYDFATGFVPQVGTALGTVNDGFGPWEPPPGFDVPARVVQAVRTEAATTLPFGQQLTNHADGMTAIVFLSQTAFGEVDSRGVNVDLTYVAGERWKGSFSYSWFDFDVERSAANLDGLLQANAPRHKISTGLSFDNDRLGASIHARWADGFRWANGAMTGDVRSFATFDLAAHYALSPRWEAGFHVANLLDDEHWQSFGGALLKRRALGYVAISW